jgi:dTDP-4-dehydrorhamnose reductase
MTVQPFEVLLIGGDGQVGTCLREQAPAHWRIAAPGRAALDIADAEAVDAAVAKRAWSLVVNAAAYTAVDRAEDDVAAAWRVNALGPACLAQATATRGLPLVHVSTDYVFDGAKGAPYLEDDPVAPLGVYGGSKEGGEQAVRTTNPAHVILRTAWVLSAHRANFAKTVLRLASTLPALRIVNDQRGNPTSAVDIADALVTVGEALHGRREACAGTYHFVNGGEATWCELAGAIVADARALGHAAPPVTPITTAEYPTRARRPQDSRLATGKLRAKFGIAPRPWPAAVKDIVGQLVGAGAQQPAS